MPLFIGCPAWGLKTWVGSFLPRGAKPRDFLRLYSRRLNTVEGNTTFYATPSTETIDRWREQTPPGFKFCLKFPQVISHRRRLRGAEAETREFLDRLERLGDRCGPAFLQLPPTFSARHLDTLIAYLDTLPREFRWAVEVRHADFFAGAEAALDDALRERGVARLTFDTRNLMQAPPAQDEAVGRAQRRKPDFPVRFTRTASFAFIRFVGDPEVQANAPLLDEWAGQAAQWLAAGDDVFFFAHHPNDTYGPAVARLFHSLVDRRRSIPPLPDWGADDALEQDRLL